MGKPTGTLGPIQISSNSDGSISASFSKIPFPTQKAEVERIIVDRFFASVNKQVCPTGDRLVFSEAKQNEENDFDFNFRTPKGPAYLELMEIAPLKGPYDSVPTSYKSYDFARTVFDRLFEKSSHYTKEAGKDLYLLLYVTHWAFALTPPAMACVRYWCARPALVFGAVFYFRPLGDEQGVADFLFPVPAEALGNFDPEFIRGADSILFDPRKGTVGGDGITWEIG
jgi:hypothetical protein